MQEHLYPDDGERSTNIWKKYW